jgi:hypothetical protein
MGQWRYSSTILDVSTRSGRVVSFTSPASLILILNLELKNLVQLVMKSRIRGSGPPQHRTPSRLGASLVKNRNNLTFILALRTLIGVHDDVSPLSKITNMSTTVSWKCYASDARVIENDFLHDQELESYHVCIFVEICDLYQLSSLHTVEWTASVV